MKERFIKVLQVTRKFGFIMAAVMVFPYVSSFPAVMASDGTSTTEAHEVSMEELEQEYLASDSQLNYDQLIIDELECYISIRDDGTLDLNIPRDTTLKLSNVELERIEDQITFVNSFIESGDIIARNEDGHIHLYLFGYDEDFVTQANENSFSVRWYGNRIRLSFYRMSKVYNSVKKVEDTIKSTSEAVVSNIVVVVLGILATLNSGNILDVLSKVLGAMGTVGTAMYVVISDIFLAVKAFFSNPYVIMVTIVLAFSAWYNYEKIKTAGTKWTDGTEIRTYGVYYMVPVINGILFPNYRDQ